MRTRKVTIITLVGLTLTLILQIGGLFYAYRSNMEIMKLTVKKSFSIAFYETIDNLVNQLPYPDGTTVTYIPIKPYADLPADEQNLRGNEYLARILKTEYGVEFPIDELAVVLKKKLKQDHIDSEVVINKIDTKTHRTLASTNPAFNRSIGVLASEPFFIDRENDIAVQAVIALSIHFRPDDHSNIQYHFTDKAHHSPTANHKSTGKLFLCISGKHGCSSFCHSG